MLVFIFCFCRYLATGESYRSLHHQFRVGTTTISNIIPEVCSAIWETMRRTYIKKPTTQDWEQIAEMFWKKWNFPNCIGAVDGKHIVIQSPAHSGSLYYNYKGTYSVVLMAVVDAMYQFICVNIGAYGKQSDAGIFGNSRIGQHLRYKPHKLKIPQDRIIPEAKEMGTMPYVIVGDEAFPLQRNIMRPYPSRKMSPKTAAFNYRLSRVRRIVECAFGILAARWRVFHTKIAVKPSTADSIVKATIVLHNLIQRDTTPGRPQDILAEYSPDCVQGFEGFAAYGTRGSHEATDIRDKFAQYFVENPLPWQEEYLRRGGRL